MNRPPVGPGCAGTIQVVLLALKLFGVVDIPWLWVLSPMVVHLVVLAIIAVKMEIEG